MAIAFARVEFVSTRFGGARRQLAYISRAEARDPGRRTFDFRMWGGDVVAEQIILPVGAPDRWGESAVELGRAVDAAEKMRTQCKRKNRAKNKHTKRTTKRKQKRRVRYPQAGLHIVLALPPDNEITLDEAIELVRTFVSWVVGALRLAIYIVIHDPALQQDGARNRHAHIFIALREIAEDGLLRSKIRNLVAQVSKSSCGLFVQGIHFPSLARKLQYHLFAMCGLDLVVDPIAPVPQPRRGRFASDPAGWVERSVMRNRAAITGSPSQLVHTLLAGRSVMPVRELVRHIDRFIDHPDDRANARDRILNDNQVVALLREPGASGSKAPDFITTDAVHERTAEVVALVDHLGRMPMHSRRIHAVAAGGAEAIIRRILAHLQSIQADATHIYVVADGMRDADQALFTRYLPNAHFLTRHKIFETLRDVSAHSTCDSPLILIIPTCSVPDQDLADLLELAKKTAIVLLAHDQSRVAGIVENRLAAFLVDRLISSYPEEADILGMEHSTARSLLQSGLIRRGVEQLFLEGLLKFTTCHEPNVDVDLVVCDTAVREAVNKTLRGKKITSGIIAPPTVVDTSQSATFSIGEWVVFERTDYSARPPRIRAGRIAKIIDIDGPVLILQPEAGTDVIRLDIRKFNDLSPAHAVDLRVARQVVNDELRIHIHLTHPNTAWAALLFATMRQKETTISIDPALATNISTLIEKIERYLPGTLPCHLHVQDCAPASLADEELSVFFADGTEAFADIERMPMPEAKLPALPASLPLGETLRARLARVPQAIVGLQRLKHALVDAEDADQRALHLLEYYSDTPTAKLIETIIQTKRRHILDRMQEADLPSALTYLAPVEVSELDIDRIIGDLRIMAIARLSPELGQGCPHPKSSSVGLPAKEGISPRNVSL